MKKFCSVIVLMTFTIGLWALPSSAKKLQEVKLENGLTVFLLEDSSDALVHVDCSVRAGFSAQTPKTNGFFKLFTRLIQKSLPQINFDDVQCNAENSRFLLTLTPSQLEPTLSDFAPVLLSPQFSEELLTSELNLLKKEVKDEAESMSGFINSAIDSRVFSETPWKHDSGIYPVIFNRTVPKNARLILDTISEKWFTPQNTALFISGNIDAESVLVLIQKTFGKYYSASGIPDDDLVLPVSQNEKRKFVIHNPEFSKDITQVVVQYPGLELEKADLIAAVLNNGNSTFKNNVLSLEYLNIIGDEYIDVSAAHKKGNSRLIFQTLMQKAADIKSKVQSVNQAEDFVAQVRTAMECTSDNEISFAKYNLSHQMLLQLENPVNFMRKLSDFWGISKNLKYADDEMLFSDSVTSVIANRMLNQLNEIQEIDAENLGDELEREPFVFVIINSDDYKKLKKEYTSAGYEEVTVKNAGWYVQRMNQEIADLYKPEEIRSFSARKTDDNGYYEANLNSISKFDLKNGIPVTVKKNPESDNYSILISVKGGKLNSADDNGFEEVMISLLGNTIQREFYKYQLGNPLFIVPDVSVQTDLYTSSIVLECHGADFEEVCKVAADAVIFGEVLPSYADRAVSSRQYKKRLENGSAVNQMESFMIEALYGKSDYAKIFETKKDVLEDTTYKKILQAYPLLLDAKRFEIIVVGNVSETSEVLEKSFGQLIPGNYNSDRNFGEMKLPKAKQSSVKINHTFLTDIPAEKAGPMPAVLIPTTEFQDPVIYYVAAPEYGSKDFSVFKALLNYLPKALEKEIAKNSKVQDAKVSVRQPEYNMNFGFVIIQNVAHTKEIDSIYKTVVKNIFTGFQDMQKVPALVNDIKSEWILHHMAETYSNTGTAQLIQKGSEFFPLAARPEYYLEEYNYIHNATVQDFLQLTDCFPTMPVYRLYSQESKK